MAKQTSALLSVIYTAVQRAPEERKSILNRMPPLHAYETEDGAVLLEWIFPGFRVGFNIEPNPEDSGWNMVKGKEMNGTAESGHLTNDKVIDLLNTILSNI